MVINSEFLGVVSDRPAEIGNLICVSIFKEGMSGADSGAATLHLSVQKK